MEEGTVRSIKILTLIAAGITTFTITASANAALALPTGWYIEGNAGTSKTSITVDGAPGASVSNSGFGWNVNAGYKFMPFFAGEVGYTKYSTANINLSGTKIAKDSIYSYDIAAKGILPVSDTGLDIFAKLGVARANAHLVNTNASIATVSNAGSSGTTGVYYGLGGEFSFLPNLAANLQWQRVHGKSSDIGNLDLYSVGLTYLFS